MISYKQWRDEPVCNCNDRHSDKVKTEIRDRGISIHYSTSTSNLSSVNGVVACYSKEVYRKLPYYEEVYHSSYGCEGHQTLIEVHDTKPKYRMFLLDETGCWGLLVSPDESFVQWKKLKLHTFISNRCKDEALVQKFMDWYSLHKEASEEVELKVTVTELVEGYNNTLVKSCMQGKGAYFEALNKYGNLYNFSYGEAQGRCIVWNKEAIRGSSGFYRDFPLDETEGYYDRLYAGDNHKLVTLMKAYLQAKKLVSVYDNKDDYDIDLVLDAELGEVEMPYMDTFRYYTPRDTLISTLYGDILLDNTDGIALTSRLVCTRCGDIHSEENGRFLNNGDFICENCLDDAYVFTFDTDNYVVIEDAYYCETNSRYYESQDELVDINGYYYHRDDEDIFYCEDCGEFFIYEETTAYCTDVGYIVCENCISNYALCEDDNEYHPKEDVHYCEDDSTYWSDKEAYSEHLQEIEDKGV